MYYFHRKLCISVSDQLPLHENIIPNNVPLRRQQQAGLCKHTLWRYCVAKHSAVYKRKPKENHESHVSQLLMLLCASTWWGNSRNLELTLKKHITHIETTLKLSMFISENNSWTLQLFWWDCCDECASSHPSSDFQLSFQKVTNIAVLCYPAICLAGFSGCRWSSFNVTDRQAETHCADTYT